MTNPDVTTIRAAETTASRLGIRITRAVFGSEVWDAWAERVLWAGCCPEAQRAEAVAEANRYAV